MTTDLEAHFNTCRNRLHAMRELGADTTDMITGFVRAIVMFCAEISKDGDVDHNLDLLADECNASIARMKELMAEAMAAKILAGEVQP